MSVEWLVGGAGVLASVLFEYVPGLNGWYNSLENNYQKLLMLLLMVVIAGGAYGLSCTGRFDYFTCDTEGIWKAVELLVVAVVANQSTHRILPR